MLKAPQLRTSAGDRSSLYSEGDAFGMLMVWSPRESRTAINDDCHDNAASVYVASQNRVKRCLQTRSTEAAGGEDQPLASRRPFRTQRVSHRVEAVGQEAAVAHVAEAFTPEHGHVGAVAACGMHQQPVHSLLVHVAPRLLRESIAAPVAQARIAGLLAAHVDEQGVAAHVEH